MNFSRASGILLHPTSLPGEFGIGDLGKEAFRFVNFLAEAGQTYWQILPLGPTGFGDSPYQCFSAWAGNTLLISPEKLVEDGLITNNDLESLPKLPAERVNYGQAYKSKGETLLRAYAAFDKSSGDAVRNNFDTFCREKDWWLDDYALYRAIKAGHAQKPWFEWRDEFKFRDIEALRTASIEFSEDVRAEKFYQFLFFNQWLAIKEYANGKGVKIVGDIPIFVALDSSDVWCNQDKFKLNADGTAKVVSGVPPDFFSKTGQLWGNPIYDWEAMRRDSFRWWAARFASALEIVDVVRIDHFRGFSSAWEVPGGDQTAENGQWVDVPGKELFEALKKSIGALPVIVEDLGFTTPDVEDLRDSFQFPGMKILQFAFGGDAGNLDLPHNFTRNCVAYTGTHDNDTTAGWFDSLTATDARAKESINRARMYCLKYLNSDGGEIHWDLIRAAWASVADTAIAPLQDILGLGSTARMNLPASISANWQWRMSKDALTDEITSRLKELTETYGRSSK